MAAMAVERQRGPEPIWSRSITTIINMAGKLVTRDGTCTGGIGEELIG